MNNCEACKRINEGADPMTLSLIHTCATKPVFDFIEQAFGKKNEVDFKIKEDSNNVIELPVNDKEFEKDQLLFGLTNAIHNLQRFVTVNSLRIFTPWDLNVIEEEISKLQILFELLKEKK